MATDAGNPREHKPAKNPVAKKTDKEKPTGKKTKLKRAKPLGADEPKTRQTDAKETTPKKKVEDTRPRDEKSDPDKISAKDERKAADKKADVDVKKATDKEAVVQSREGEEESTEEEYRKERGSLAQWWHDSPSWLSSLVLHAVVLLILALMLRPVPDEDTKPGLRFTNADAMDDAEDIEDPDVMLDDPDVIQPDTTVIEAEPSFSPFEDIQEATASVELVDFGTELAPSNILGDTGGFDGKKGLSGRGHKARSRLARGGGGGTDTEEAVARALKWLAVHQLPNGNWSFDHRQGVCQGRCPNPGQLKTSFNGATAMALLPFLGAGQTHKEGEYKDLVRRGLYYLTRSMQVTRDGGGLMDGGTMYSHGLGAIALCEAYAMTEDRNLQQPAQLALNFIMTAQDPVGGGWRYKPRMPGDTSVVGWQIMALKSGHMAYLNVSPNTIRGAIKFLNSVQADGGAAYGYTVPGRGEGTTSVGLLSRMFLGWKQDTPALQMGVKRFDKAGPSPTNFYYNYYATQIMFQYTGGKTSNPIWNKWNNKMKNQLLKTQARQGHAAGSWFAGKDHASSMGGRLYCTSMATMILEVYYRHMPIFQQEAVKNDFPE